MIKGKQKSFVFDLNRCTGCGACIVGCATENMGNQQKNWREIYVFNESRHPAMPLFSLSMACNHCVDPACESACPAQAYSKDEDTGAVTVDPEKCMGCKYCTWACPYDAPRYNPEAGVVEKCDFCVERLKNDELPACVCACPVDALRLGDLETENEDKRNTDRVPGFTVTDIEPAVRFVPLRSRQRVPEMTAPPDRETVSRLFESTKKIPERKISLKSEWTLLLFTMTASLLVAFLTAMLSAPLGIDPYLFLGAGAVAMVLSTVHLGRKFRAYRAAFNLARSWLSREIVVFSSFLFLAGLYLILFPYVPLLGRIAAGVGFLALLTIDKIYQVAMQTSALNFHSAHTLLNGLFLTGIIAGNVFITAFFGVLKLLLYMYRKVLFLKTKRKTRPLISLLRVTLGFILPITILIWKPGAWFDYYWFIIIAVIIAELIDRTEYYDELDIISPRKQILIDMEKTLLRTDH